MKGMREVIPYVPGEQPNFAGMIKLNTNENPYAPSPNVEKVLRNYNPEQLKRYPSVSNQELKQALAIFHNLSPECFAVGNGSDELLAFCFLAFFNSKDPILFPDITYGFYKVWANLFRVPYKEIPLDKKFEIESSDYSIANGGIVLANPNAPTGLFMPHSELIKILEQNKEVMVVIDEAYIDFAGESAQSLMTEYENVVIVRTFSKGKSLAGLRIGYAIGQPKFIQMIEQIKNSFNPYSLDSLAEKVAVAALKDEDYFAKTIQNICEIREWFKEEIAKLNFQTLETKTNFLLTTHPTADIQQLYTYLTDHYIFVRYFPENKRLKKYLRISIGTREEMNKLVQVLTDYL